VHLRGDRVDEGLGSAVGRETHGRRRPEGLGACRQVELDGIRLHGEERGALLGFETSEVLSGHAAAPLGAVR
jgi:hypothetical protein